MITRAWQCRAAVKAACSMTGIKAGGWGKLIPAHSLNNVVKKVKTNRKIKKGMTGKIK